MPFCPKCSYEYEAGILKCADCDTPLVESLPTEEHLQSRDLEVVYTCSELIEAEMIKANLESVEIEATLLVQKDQNFPTVGDLSVIKVFVPHKQAEAARNFLENPQPLEENGDTGTE